jgi:hypothetical protein
MDQNQIQLINKQMEKQTQTTNGVGNSSIVNQWMDAFSILGHDFSQEIPFHFSKLYSSFSTPNVEYTRDDAQDDLRKITWIFTNFKPLRLDVESVLDNPSELSIDPKVLIEALECFNSKYSSESRKESHHDDTMENVNRQIKSPFSFALLLDSFSECVQANDYEAITSIRDIIENFLIKNEKLTRNILKTINESK